MGIVGVTMCPECDATLQPSDSNDDRPIQTVTQSCSECSYETKIALLWYGQRGYEIIADVSQIPEKKKQRCDKSGDIATTVVIPIEVDVPIYYSESNTRGHHRRALRTIIT